MEIAARLAKVTALIISRDVVIDYALYGTPELALVANNRDGSVNLNNTYK